MGPVKLKKSEASLHSPKNEKIEVISTFFEIFPTVLL